MPEAVFFVLPIIAMSMGAWVLTTWIRAKHGYPVENEWSGFSAKSDPDAERKIALLSDENVQLMQRIKRMEQRIEVLEKIVTDPAAHTARAIEALR